MPNSNDTNQTVDSLEVNDGIIKELEQEQSIMTDQVNTNQVPVNSLPVTAIINVLNFLVAIADVFHDVTAPTSSGGAKITFAETLQFLPVAMKAPAAISSLGEIPAELNDQITQEELSQIAAVITSSEFLAENANVSQVTTDGLALANQIKTFIQTYFVKK